LKFEHGRRDEDDSGPVLNAINRTGFPKLESALIRLLRLHAAINVLRPVLKVHNALHKEK